MDTNKTVWDQQQLDFINHNQTKVYISHVEVNQYIRYGIRAHVYSYTNALLLRQYDFIINITAMHNVDIINFLAFPGYLFIS